MTTSTQRRQAPRIAANGNTTPRHVDSAEGAVHVAEESVADLLAQQGDHEGLLLLAKDKTGKSSALLSMARFVIRLTGAHVYVHDLEGGLLDVMKSWQRAGIVLPDPDHFHFYRPHNMNEVLAAFDQSMERFQRQVDWMMIDSMAKVWEMAQDYGYKAQTGLLKAEYLAERRAKAGGRAKGSPLPADPDKFWNVVKDAHDANFMDAMSTDSGINYLWTAGLSKPPSQRDNADRVNFRDESGLDLNPMGAPKLAYNSATNISLRKKGGHVVARVLGDRNAFSDEPVFEFDVQNRQDFASAFYIFCRGMSQEDVDAVLS